MTEKALASKTSEAKKENPASSKLKAEHSPSACSPVERIMFLQRTVGNKAVQRLIKSGTLRTRLKIGQPNDIYEQEADRVAEQVMQATVQPRFEEKGPSHSKETLQVKETTGSFPELTPDLEGEISSIKGSGTLNRLPTDEAGCSGYKPDEVRISHTSEGHLDPDVRIIAPGRLLIADFGVDWRHVKPSTQSEPLLLSWLSTFESDDSYRLSIAGYSDCVGAERHNTGLRHGRAERVEGLLGRGARSRVTFRGMAGLGSYVTDNNNPGNRAMNRSAVIEFSREFTFQPEEIKVTPRRCGPDVTQWLIDQMNTNYNHPTIRKMRETRWPRYVPGVNIGWTAAALYDFAQLVRGGGPWDFKSNQGWWRAGGGRTCPTTECDRTVTMCGMCFNYDVPGNIHFGWIGRAAELRSWLLHFGAGIVQPGRWTDDPKDAVAVAIGERMLENGVYLCDELRRLRSQLNLDKTENCSSCNQS